MTVYLCRTLHFKNFTIEELRMIILLVENDSDVYKLNFDILLILVFDLL